MASLQNRFEPLPLSHCQLQTVSVLFDDVTVCLRVHPGGCCSKELMWQQCELHVHVQVVCLIISTYIVLKDSIPGIPI